MITIQQKLFRLLMIFLPAMQDQKLASPVVASLQGEEQPVAAVLRPSHQVQAYMQKAGDCGDKSLQFFLDFPQNFRLRTRNQYCTQAIAWGSTILDGGSTILDGGSTILDGNSTIFRRFSPFFIDFHDLRTFVAIYILSRFTHFFRKFFLAKISSLQHHTFFACMFVLTFMAAVTWLGTK